MGGPRRCSACASSRSELPQHDVHGIVIEVRAASLIAFACAASGCDLIFPLDVQQQVPDDGSVRDDTVPPPIDALQPTAYALQVLADQPLAYWRFGTDSAAMAIDATGNDHTGFYSAPVVLEPGAIPMDAENALSVDGTYHVSMGQKFGFEGNATFSVEAWVRSDQIGTNGGMVSKETETGGINRRGWNLLIVVNTKSILFERTVGEGVVQAVQSAADTLLPDGAFRHVVATFEGVVLALYLDGALVSTNTTNPVSVPAHAKDFAIGGRNGGLEERFKGGIDEVAVYDHPLTLDRIAIHHAVGVVR
jgi:large repetitive protein